MYFHKISIKGSRIFLCGLLAITLSAGTQGQESGSYSIISVNGRIVDQKSGKDLDVGQKVLLQTTLQFGAPSDRAIVVSPSLDRYRLELPPASSALLISSDYVLHEIKSRPQLITGTRSIAPISKSVSVDNLKAYFLTDTFTIIGSHLEIPVRKQDRGKFDLMFRYESNSGVDEIRFDDFTVHKSQIGLRQIDECYIQLCEGEISQPVKCIKLCFIQENTLFKEFSALLTSLAIPQIGTPACRQELKQYCADVYGTMDPNQLNKAISRFFDEAASTD